MDIQLVRIKGNFLTNYHPTHSMTSVAMPLFGVIGHNMTHIGPLRRMF